MSGRSYLSIGDVLTLLRQEFEDITISKIRFLESQGLVNPERTPSGYRKFYEHDVERLRWVLRQQREHFLPLKVIKDRLDDGSAEADAEGPPPVAASRAAKVTGRRHHSDPADPAETEAPDPVLVGQRVGAEGESRATPVSSHPAGEGAGLPGFVSPAESAAGGPAPVPAGTTRTPARTGVSSHRRSPDRAPLLELVNDGTAGGSRAASADPVNGTGDGGAGGSPSGAGTTGSGPPVAGTAVTGPSAAQPASPGGSSGPSSGPSAGEPAGEPSGPSAPPVKAATTPQSTPPPASPAPSPPTSKAPTATAETPPPPSSEASGVSLSAEELAAASELDVTVVRELQEYGLLVPSMVAGVEYFDEESLAVASVAAHFTRFGIEPRHLRLYKNAAEREAGFVEQVVLPLVRQRNPEARARAHETADELTRLGQQLRGSLLRSALGNLLNG